MKVPFNDLARGTAALRSELDAAAARVLDSGWYVLGAEGRAFEEEFAAALGAGSAAGVANGTDAIELALRALGIGPGDEVVTQANTCVPTISGIERAGATPVLCDVEREGATMDPASLEQALTPRTKAVIPVHLYGQCAEMDPILALAGERGIAVVEDCAQAHLARYRGRTAGTMGALAAFSFYPTKNLGALGDGGGVVAQDPELAERVRLLRMYGQAGRYEHVAHGVNSRLDELQAALLRAKLPHLPAWHERRNAIAAAYDEALAGTAVRPLARLPEREHAFHLYVAVAEDRERFQAAMTEAGVGTLVHYPRPVHGHEPYRALGNGVPLVNAEHLAERVVSLPVYPELTDAEVEHVAAAARAAAA
ncbi:MAG: Glutamine--scyllo-inositol transaminase [Solirubrobacterales bacterium]|nr:Glutamine--scyllo-inositol transaminase [Solirubrobacterales bacterium]